MTILIITDQPKEAQLCEKLLQKVADNIEEIVSCSSENEAVKWLKNNGNPDIIFVWQQVSGKNGLEIIRKSGNESSLVIVAENDLNILEVFRYNTLDYIIQPLNAEKIKLSIEKFNRYFKEQSEIGYMKNLQSLMTFMAKKEKDYKKRFMIKVGNTIKSIAVEDIAYLFSQDRINYLVNFKGKKFPVDNTLDEIEEMLDPAKFFRANRQFIVSIDSISEIHPYFKGRVKINLNPIQEGDIVISSEKSRSFKEWLDV
jgi:two-component system, LytTR family, response regulator LytT